MASNDHDMRDSLKQLRAALRQAEQRIVATMRPPAEAAQEAQPERDDRLAFGERMADQLAQLAGKWTFILSFLAMDQVEQRALTVLRRPAQEAEDEQGQHQGRTAIGERMADRLAQLVGKWTFILSFLALRHAEQHIVGGLRRPTQHAHAEREEPRAIRAHMAERLGQFARKWPFVQGLMVLAALWLTVRPPRRPASAGAVTHTAPAPSEGAR